MLLDASRDRARLARILELDNAGLVNQPQARHDAALVLLHGACPAHFRRAMSLARAAADAGVPGARQLAKAAEDRWLLSPGRAQRNDTQLVVWGAVRCAGWRNATQ